MTDERQKSVTTAALMKMFRSTGTDVSQEWMNGSATRYRKPGTGCRTSKRARITTMSASGNQTILL